VILVIFDNLRLHGNVVTQLKCGVRFNNCVIASCLQNPPMKIFWKLVNIWRRYGKWQSGTFFGTQTFADLCCGSTSCTSCI